MGIYLKTHNLEDLLRTRSRAEYQHQVNISDLSQEDKSKMIAWCHKNCSDKWTVNPRDYALYVQFESSNDLLLFCLTHDIT